MLGKLGKPRGAGMDVPSSINISLFESFRLDRRSGVLFKRGERGDFAPLAMGSRALEILKVLVERAGELVTRAEIMAAVWAGTAVEDSNLNVQIAVLRRILDAGQMERSCIQTVPGRGYRFTAPVTQVVAEAQPNAVAVGMSGVPALLDKPTLAVMPFQNMSGDPKQEYFVDGIVEEIITALSRIRWLFVIARNSSFTYKGQAVDVKQVGRELGVRYVLEGSVRKAGNRLRITGQLLDAATGAHLWADRIDGPLEDVFDLQDKVASSVSGVIEPALQVAETARSAGRSTNDLTAYDFYLRAHEMAWSSALRIPEALRLTEQAIARDPRYAPALAFAAFCCFRLLIDGRSEDRATDRQKGADFARRALEVAGDDPGILANAAFALAYFGEDIGAMMALVERALALNPNFADGWNISGTIRIWAGQPEIAIEHLKAALRLSPLVRIGTSRGLLGAAYFHTRRFNEAVSILRLAVQEDPTFPAPYRVLAACYAHMGRIDDAREIVARLRAITPVVIPDASFIRDPEHRELFLSGLRLAAGEAT